MIRLYCYLRHLPDHGTFLKNCEVTDRVEHYIDVRRASGGEIYWRDCFDGDFQTWGLHRYADSYGMGRLLRDIPDGWQMMTEDDYIVLIVEKKLDALF